MCPVNGLAAPSRTAIPVGVSVDGPSHGSAADDNGDGCAVVVCLQLNEKLALLKIEVRLNERIEGGAPDDAMGMVAGHAQLRTDKGATIETDLQFWTTGPLLPNTGFLRAHYGAALDASGRARVNEYFQVRVTLLLSCFVRLDPLSRRLVGNSMSVTTCRCCTVNPVRSRDTTTSSR